MYGLSTLKVGAFRYQAFFGMFHVQDLDVAFDSGLDLNRPDILAVNYL